MQTDTLTISHNSRNCEPQFRPDFDSPSHFAFEICQMQNWSLNTAVASRTETAKSSLLFIVAASLRSPSQDMYVCCLQIEYFGSRTHTRLRWFNLDLFFSAHQECEAPPKTLLLTFNDFTKSYTLTTHFFFAYYSFDGNVVVVGLLLLSWISFVAFVVIFVECYCYLSAALAVAECQTAH